MSSYSENKERFRLFVFRHKVYAYRIIYPFLPDRTALRLKYRYRTGKKLNLKNPRTFTEKMQWLKLYDRNPAYTAMADKLLAKEYVGNIIGREHVVPLLGTWDSPDEIDFDSLPDRFVLKCNHDSGSRIFCKNKADFDIAAARRHLWKKLKTSHFKNDREWAYRDIKRKIFAEEYLEDPNDRSGFAGLTDYKFMCADGRAHMMFITHDIDLQAYFDVYDEDFNHLDILSEYNNPDPPKKPVNYEKMRFWAEKLSENIPFVRVDFYEIGDKFYFGEMTFYPMGGTLPEGAGKWEQIFGDWISLPEKRI